MRTFKSLHPDRLPADFDVEVQTEEPIVNVEESESQIKISYIFPGFYLADTPQEVSKEKLDFQLVDIENVGSVAESGKPLLPSFGRYVHIPPNTTYKMKVEKSNPVTFDNVLVAPAQTQMKDSYNSGHLPVFEFDRAFYKKDTLYPEKIVEVTGPMQVNEYDALLLHVRPVQYNAAKHQLTGYGNITVTLTLTHKVSDQPTQPRVSGSDEQAFTKFFLNPPMTLGSSVISNQPTIVEPIKFPPMRIDPTQFLIIYYDTFKSAAEKLALWKNQRGLRTEIVPISKIGNTSHLIKNYIRGRRGSLLSALRYVLLLGDTDKIPSEYFPDAGQYYPANIGNIVTDYFYSTRFDAINHTLLELQPWISLGRITTDTLADALDVVNEIIAYEKNPPTSGDFYKHLLVAAYLQDANDSRGYVKTMDKVHDVLVNNLGYNVDKVYTCNTPNPTPPYYPPATATQKLIKATNEGRLFIGHRDHGDVNGWFQPPFTVNDLNQVTGTTPSVFFSVNCLTGMFDSEKAPVLQKESFADKLLRIKATAPSLIAATRLTDTYLNNALILAIYDAMFGSVLPSYPGGSASYPVVSNRIGDILNYAKIYLPIVVSPPVGNVTPTDRILEEWELYHVLGDPSLELWKQAPLPIKVGAVIIGNKLLINLSAVPAGCTLTIWQNNKLTQQLQPKTTRLVISLSGTSLTEMAVHICCWAPSYHFAETTVIVRPVLHPVP